ncbi:glycogen debranching N-terminal domain-containing protein [Amycolatopsis sp. NPDC051128]|uniref:amylo-alpha-1,6-glucosidase n=1 Tax=Amycolatopsis sp. NPDC051128 TaxID=3155412 RepID=UPI00342EB495
MDGHLLLAGSTFLVTDEAGDVPGGDGGLFVDDTRHLSAWQLLVDGDRPRPLAARRDDVCAEVVLAPVVARGSDPPYAVFRTQVLDGTGLVERLRVRNLEDSPRTVEVRWLAAADFADQFELRTDRGYAKPGATRATDAGPDGLVLRYRRDGYVKTTTVSPGQAVADDRGLVWRPRLGAHAEATLTVRVSAAGRGPADVDLAVADRRAERDEFRSAFTLPEIDDPTLRAAVHNGLDALASLMIPVPGSPGARVPGAGAPWFLTLFGRDSLITSMAALPYAPGIAASTLRALAAHQGREVRPDRCEEPGKIPHELRSGELSRFGQVPYARYYGSVDATPLFLVTLGAHHERTGDDALALELEPAARAAVSWLEDHSGLTGRGFLVYRTDSPGLVHQCWKDSARSIVFPDGEPAPGPIAACEVQGYAFDALTRTARLARHVWHDPRYADRLTARADALRDRFTTAFWSREQDFPALALDARGRRVDLLASNAGHLLWSGLLDARQANAVADRLLAHDFFSGWGLRTVAAGQGPYHPLSYHNGGVWPHDTAIAVAGFARYGLGSPARRLADGLLDAAARCGFRLPEVLTGFGSGEVADPVPYPHSCSPQAWAAAAPLFLLTASAR